MGGALILGREIRDTAAWAMRWQPFVRPDRKTFKQQQGLDLQLNSPGHHGGGDAQAAHAWAAAPALRPNRSGEAPKNMPAR